MPQPRATSRARIAKGIAAATAVGALVLTAVTFGGVGASATSVVNKVVYQPTIGAETAASYPVNPWFVGYSSNASRGTSMDGNDLSLNVNTQLLYQLPTADTDLTTLVSGLSAGTVSGDMTFQIYLTWGDSGWTTLRSADGVDTTATVTPHLSDSWISSKPVTVSGTNNTEDTLGNLIADVNTISGGTYAIHAVGVYGGPGTDGLETDPTDISFLQFDNTKYTFAADATVGSATSTQAVHLGSIGRETEAGYPSNTWFFGDNEYTGTGATGTSSELTLNAGTQLLKQFTDSNRPSNLESFINSGVSWTTDATTAAQAYFQIPINYGPSASSFTTLRPAPGVPVAGLNRVQYGAQWVSSHAIGTVDTPGYVAASTPTSLGNLVEAINAAGGTEVVKGFGVFADYNAETLAKTKLVSMQAGGVNYVFSDPLVLVIDSLTISGTAQVGQTLTAVPQASTPGASFSYQWYSGSSKISGAKSRTYVVGGSRAGQKINVHVTASKSGYVSGQAVSASTSAVIAGTYAAAAVTIAGTPNVGRTLTATVTGAAVGNKAYQWYRNGTKITSGTSSTRTLTATDINSAITVHVTLSSPGFSTRTVDSAATDKVGLGVLTLGTPHITGSAKVGSTLTAHAGSSTSGVKLMYWFTIDGVVGDAVQVSGSPQFTIPVGLRGGTVSVFTSGTKAGFAFAYSAGSPLTAGIQ